MLANCADPLGVCLTKEINVKSQTRNRSGDERRLTKALPRPKRRERLAAIAETAESRASTPGFPPTTVLRRPPARVRQMVAHRG